MESRLFYIMGKLDKKTTLEELSRIDSGLRRYGVDTCEDYGYSLDFDGSIEIRNLLYEQIEAIYRQIFWNLRIKVVEIGEQVFNEDSEDVEDIVIYNDSMKPVRLTEPWSFVEAYIKGSKIQLCESDEPEDDEDCEDDEDGEEEE